MFKFLLFLTPYLFFSFLANAENVNVFDFTENELNELTVRKVRGAENKTIGCTECPFGTYEENVGSTKCTSCSGGRYGVLLGGKNESHGCNNCSTGRYGDVSGSPTIEIGCPDFCPHGKYGFKTGARIASDGCRNCSRGTYGENQNICSICLANTFQNITGQSNCTNCPIGKFTKSIGIQIRTFHDDISDCLYPKRTASREPWRFSDAAHCTHT